MRTEQKRIVKEPATKIAAKRTIAIRQAVKKVASTRQQALGKPTTGGVVLNASAGHRSGVKLHGMISPAVKKSVSKKPVVRKLMVDKPVSKRRGG